MKDKLERLFKTLDPEDPKNLLEFVRELERGGHVLTGTRYGYSCKREGERPEYAHIYGRREDAEGTYAMDSSVTELTQYLMIPIRKEERRPSRESLGDLIFLAPYPEELNGLFYPQEEVEAAVFRYQTKIYDRVAWGSTENLPYLKLNTVAFQVVSMAVKDKGVLVRAEFLTTREGVTLKAILRELPLADLRGGLQTALDAEGKLTILHPYLEPVPFNP